MESSEEEDFSDDDIVDIFGESEDEDDFGGFNFTLPDKLETDEGGAKTRGFYEQNPRKGISVPQSVLPEYLASSVAPDCRLNEDKPLMHSLSGDCRRYILGDRFHSASNLHKSKLCAFHDINLRLQANSLKTSYQECENNRKNICKLRGACVQGFGVHFLYNYLMDYYQNEQIVHREVALLKRNAQGNCDIVRDEFMRFVFKQAESKK
ncbi:hypothetical protein ACROYT_G014478 [Oculina patagonica]